MKIPRLLLFVIIVAVVYGIFKAPGFFLKQPIPSSLILMYMFFVVITVLLWMTSTEEGMQGLVGPIKALIEDPGKKRLRNKNNDRNKLLICKTAFSLVSQLVFFLNRSRLTPLGIISTCISGSSLSISLLSASETATTWVARRQ